VIELTDRGPAAWAVFTTLAEQAARHDPQAILGAGSVRDPEAADRFIASGARFIVGPSFSADVARLCNRRRVPYLPGCATPTEIVAAEESGVELVKLFPGDSLGPGFLKAIRGPLPETQVVVTGGVQATEASVGEWIRAGAACLGFGSALITKAHTDPSSDADPSALTPAVAHLIALVAAARAAGTQRPA
jgi:2-dehydro-3-deoxyphosphogluconate aldolase/(4S)-4-hydroxy-2-oxoglutarate aldolase